MFGSRGFSHQPHSPDFSLQRAEPRTYFNVVIIEKGLAHGGFLDSIGHAYSVELPQLVPRLGCDAQAQILEPIHQSLVIGLMPSPSRSRPSSSTSLKASCSA